MPDGLVMKKIIYNWTKLTNELWSQNSIGGPVLVLYVDLEISQEVEEERKLAKDKRRTVNAATSKKEVLEANELDVDHFKDENICC